MGSTVASELAAGGGAAGAAAGASRFRPYDDIDGEFVRTDRHIHSTFSDGRATVAEIAARAVELGLAAVAIVDHVRRDSGYVRALVREVHETAERTGLPMLAGVEAKVADLDGSLDLAPDAARAADLVVASVHRFPLAGRLVFPSELAPEECREIEYRLTMAALERGGFDVLGHPGGMSVRATGAFPPRHFADIIGACAAAGVAFELNAAYHRGLRPVLAPLLTERGCLVSMGSDAHDVSEVGAWVALWDETGAETSKG